MTTGPHNPSDRPPNGSASPGRPAGGDTAERRGGAGERDVDDEPRTHHMHHDPESNVRLSTAIVRRVANLSGDEPTTIEPLYHSVEPDALDRLVDESRPDGGVLEFTFHGYGVRATDDGDVTFEPVTDDSTPER